MKQRLKFENGPSRRVKKPRIFSPKQPVYRASLGGGLRSPLPLLLLLLLPPPARHQHASKRRKSCMCPRPYVATTFGVTTWTVPGACAARHSLHRTGGRAQPPPPPRNAWMRMPCPAAAAQRKSTARPNIIHKSTQQVAGHIGCHPSAQCLVVDRILAEVAVKRLLMCCVPNSVLQFPLHFLRLNPFQYDI